MSISSVSIVICTWNRSRLLAEMLAGMRQLRVPANLQIETLVVDNNSSDDTAATVRRLQEGWSLGELRYLHEGRQGKQFALNLAVRSARGEVLVFTDDDVVLSPDWLERIAQVFADPAVELAGGKTLPLWPGDGPPAWFRPSMFAVVAGVDLGDRVLNPPPADYAPAGTNLIARRSIFERIGLYSETHFRHMDYEFGTRALRSGVAVEYNPALIVYTPVPAEILNKRYFRRWYFKLGIAAAMRADATVAQLLGVPRWIWRQMLVDAFATTTRILRGRADAAFEYEMRLRQLLGQVCAVWHRKLRPSTHQRWVERWSQKRGATFG